MAEFLVMDADLEVSAPEDTLIKDKSMSNKLRLRELDVGVSAPISQPNCSICDFEITMNGD